MTLKGIDISNWQSGLKLSALNVDFMICKATEGVGYVDRSCDGFVQQAISKGIKWGIYHFARSNDAASEADYFYKNIKGYIGKGIPVLDYEVWGANSNDVAWCEKFLQRFHDLTGIWAMLYISASHCKDFNGSWIPQRCGLWVAGYPKAYTGYPDANMPYSIAPWSVCAIWQFTSSLRLSGFNGNLDGDYAYMDAGAWNKYAGASSSSSSSSSNSSSTAQAPDYNALADEVINGKWDNGQERKDRLNVAYGSGTYDKVQAIVNKKLQAAPDYEKLATEVINGKWGNGWNREQALNNAYGSGTYEKVQAIVNKRLR